MRLLGFGCIVVAELLCQDVDGILDIYARGDDFHRSSLYHGLACEYNYSLSIDHVYHTKTESYLADMRR